MDDDNGEKSHEATQHRRDKAREEGQVVKSQDLTSAAMLMACLLLLWYFSSGMFELVGAFTRDQITGQLWQPITLADVTSDFARIGGLLARTLLPLLLMMMLAAITIQLSQTGFLFLPNKLAMDLERINPLNNSKRIFAVSNLVSLGFGLLKVLLIGVVAGLSLWQQRATILELTDQSAAVIGKFVLETALWTSIKIAAALLVLAILDYGYQWWKHEQDLRMTTQQVREEMKEQTGDPQTMQRRKQIQRQLVMNRLSTSIPKADVIVTNPTELAIALQYDPNTMPAPIVIAKGAGVLAQRIRRLALENNVPVVERKELARALYQLVEVNQPVPSEQYAAVAEVVRYVYQLKGKKLPGTRAKSAA
ncbi:type III secretion exporter [Pirellula staleyi DSM 6068]|uniref:Type III secretion exporter n=1 Tax=Pirellula staleyi (strain ATCC 27377 / DSM 6068 / ICPB 4128) TaxID=530564 RepID=D2R543_PIRSD|nr:EscU/YscU/HrcU family type III secretion system export apparatus switch protein [Pirellula staleyi]ADB19005.1 type III secretion exporter [Pirellula staleyi DSM 6068]